MTRDRKDGGREMEMGSMMVEVELMA